MNRPIQLFRGWRRARRYQRVIAKRKYEQAQRAFRKELQENGFYCIMCADGRTFTGKIAEPVKQKNSK